MKKYCIVPVLIIIAITIISCQKEKNDSMNQIMTLLGLTGGISSSSQKIIPKMNNTVFLPSASKSLKSMNVAKLFSSTGDVSANFDYNHLFICELKEWIQLICQLSAPVFNGFEYSDYKNGDIFESDFYKKKVTTTITETDENVEFNGNFNDSGGYYKLVINKIDKTYTFEQMIIADTVLVQTACLSYPIGDPNRGSYIAQAVRLCIYSTVNGTINGTDTDGEGISRIADLNPSSVERGEIRSAEDFDLTVSTGWVNGTGYVYDFIIKSRGSFFGMRNNVPGQLRYQFNNFTANHSSDTPSYVLDLSSIGYQSVSFWDIVKIMNTFPQPPAEWDQSTQGSYGPFQCQLYGPNCDYLVYLTSEGWQPVIWCGAMADDGNTPTQELIDQRYAQIIQIWDNY